MFGEGRKQGRESLGVCVIAVRVDSKSHTKVPLVIRRIVKLVSDESGTVGVLPTSVGIVAEPSHTKLIKKDLTERVTVAKDHSW